MHSGIFVGSRGISRIGDFMLLVAINLWVLNTTHSPQAVSVLWIVPALAQLVVSPWAGSFTDRLNKKSVMIIVEVVRAGIIGAMALTSNLWFLYSALFLVNGVGSFFSSASLPYMTCLVPIHLRKRVNAIMGMLQSGALVIGPALTGVVLSLSGRTSMAIWLDALSFLLSALCLLMLPNLSIEPISFAPDKSTPWDMLKMWTRDVIMALQVLKARKIFTFLYVVVTLIGILGVATDSQEAVFARTALHLSSSAYSWLIAIAGAGYIIGAGITTLLTNRLTLKFMIGVGSSLACFGYVIYAWSQSLVVASMGFVVLGIFQSLSGAGFSTLYQCSLPSEYMGRISNVTSPLTQGFIIIFTVVIGIVTGSMGVRLTTICSTAFMSLLGLIALIAVYSIQAKGVFQSVENQLTP